MLAIASSYEATYSSSGMASPDVSGLLLSTRYNEWLAFVFPRDTNQTPGYFCEAYQRQERQEIAITDGSWV